MPANRPGLLRKGLDDPAAIEARHPDAPLAAEGTQTIPVGRQAKAGQPPGADPAVDVQPGLSGPRPIVIQNRQIGTLRHAFITAALDAGVPLRDVQEAASHADPRTTMRYDRARASLDRHATYIVAAYVAGAAR